MAVSLGDHGQAAPRVLADSRLVVIHRAFIVLPGTNGGRGTFLDVFPLPHGLRNERRSDIVLSEPISVN
jgi:hypothetical protein